VGEAIMASKEEKTETGETKPASEEKAKKEEMEESKKETTPKDESQAKESSGESPDEKAAAEKSEAAATTSAGQSSNSASAAAATTPAATVEEAQETEERGKRVYVGNLAWQVSWQDLKDHMKSTGLDVVRTNVMTAPDGRSKGCGIVEFATADDAEAAVQTFNDTELKGRQIFVREDREAASTGMVAFSSPGAGGGSGHRFSSDEQAQNRRVYVGNLSWDVAWQDLKDHMKQAGEVAYAEIITDQHTGRSKGCGVVEFASEDEARTAIDTLSNTDLKGRTIFVREDRETTSKSAAGASTGGRGQNPSVYVWNLSMETSWQDLKDHMRKAGNVDSATVFPSSDGETNSGIVVYQRPQEAARAIRELQGSELHGLQMNLREDRLHTGRGGQGRGGGGAGRGRGGGRGGRGSGGGSGSFGGGRGSERSEPGTTLFIGNLSYDTTWRDLKDHFKSCGEIKRAEVKTTPQGQSRGFGTVQFFNKEDAEAAINNLNGSELHGRELEVRLDQKPR